MPDSFHRRQALHIATQLPTDPKDALVVLDYARDLVVRFLAREDGEGDSSNVTAFSASKSSR